MRLFVTIMQHLRRASQVPTDQSNADPEKGCCGPECNFICISCRSENSQDIFIPGLRNRPILYLLQLKQGGFTILNVRSHFRHVEVWPKFARRLRDVSGQPTTQSSALNRQLSLKALESAARGFEYKTRSDGIVKAMTSSSTVHFLPGRSTLFLSLARVLLVLARSFAPETC